ncbi:MAG: universal stress protein [Chloroflexota bacterium]
MGKPDPAIRGAVARCHASVVVMATHGRSGVSRLVLGSVADAVIDQANIPVVLIGPRALEKSRRPLAGIGAAA